MTARAETDWEPASQGRDDGRPGVADEVGEPSGSEQGVLAEVAAVLAPRAGAALTALAEKRSAPVVMSRNAGGAVPAHHRLAFSSLAAPRQLPSADVVLVVGSRFVSPRGTALPTAPGAAVVLVDADPADLGPPRRADLTLCADARTAEGRERRTPVVVRPRTARGDPGRRLPGQRADPGGLSGRRRLPRAPPGNLPHARLPGHPGYGYPSALGVKAVVFNDNAYGNVRRIPADEFEGRFIGSDLTSPDFVRLAESFSVPALRAETPARLAGALKECLSEPGPSLIEVPVAEMPGVWPLLLGGSPGSVRD
ncbi:thiamine pyrophosphate-dependent enzyme [Streptomyces sp. TRM70350]|uniref:thiamine pyrophosphate-dependent enzyme n=1 Tax=Streptomyces sp. TRM70350 TaxID=2856165 RepID=UPI001C46824C|nr:thiamine pyrophosphate-dependent enzyme [Streptomyces sp. TRM70350]MBV7695465.1 hypothetical protein [Streptomyces sp. TRM70350]